MFSRLKNQVGMTLIEIMVVVAIIGGITALVAVKVTASRERANIQLTKTQMSNLLGALDQYKLDNHRYPSTEQGLSALKEKPSSGTVPKDYPDGGYVKKIPQDPWDGDFNYSSPGTHGEDVEIWSNGPDGEQDTADDIKSWDMENEDK